MTSFHTGWAEGYLWQFILLLATLGVPFLASTGVASYLKRKVRLRPRPLHRGSPWFRAGVDELG